MHQVCQVKNIDSLKYQISLKFDLFTLMNNLSSLGLGALGGGGWNGTSHEITKGKSFLYGAEGNLLFIIYFF